MRKAYVFKERQRYSIRKYSFGAASVLIGASLMLGGHALAQEQANSTSSSKDYEVFVNNSEPLQIDQATSEAVTDVLNEPASRSEAPRPKLASSEVASSEASSVVSSEVASLEVPAEVAHSASAVASVSRSEVATPRSEVSSVASSEVVSEINRSATSEVAEVRGTDREAVDTSLRTVLTNASQPGVDGPVTADGSLDIPSNGTYYFRRTTEIRTAPIMDIKPTFVFSAGDHVIYDKVLKKDNHQWISYIGYDYERYYADIAALKAENTSSTTEATRDETIPERGTYYFTKPADVKNQPSLTAKTEFNFDPGMSVNYDRSLLADNHRWISYTSYSGTRRYVDLGAVAEAVAKPRGDIAIESHDNGDFSVVISNVSDQNGVLGVSVPIWSEKNGQDDIIWYNATRLNNGNYKVNVSLSDHKNERGLYNVHLYYVQNDGSRIGVGGTQTKVTLSDPKADLAITGLNNATGSYDLVISNLVAPQGFKEVLVPTWSEKNGQDDIIWYKAAKQANGDYKVTVRSSNHKGDSGLYNSHVYLVDNDGKYIGLGGKQVTLDITKTQGTLTIVNNDKNRGTFDVLITNLTNPSGISGLLIPVWSEQNGQDDLVWHNATKQDDGSYKVTISASQHKWNSGKYIVHGYIVDASGKNIGFGATSADVVAPKKIGSASRGNYDVLNKVVYLDAGHGGYDPGASYFGISEKSLTLAIQSRVKAKLEAEGYQVVTTRTSDTYVDLADRSRAANASESDIFVSIHINASGSSAAQGIETYYYQPYAEYPSRINATYHANPTRLSMSDTLANAIQSSLINATGAQNQGVKRQTFAVLRETTAPAVLLELGFLSNPQEATRLNTSAYQETLANAIVAGIKSYYEKESKV